MKPEVYDAVIIGGGPAGASAAILLARSGWSVALIEKANYPRRKVCGEFLSATNWPLLQALGVACQFARIAGPVVDQVGLFVRDRCIRAPMPRPAGSAHAFGHALGRESLDSLLLDRAIALGTRVFQPCRAASVERVGEGLVCHLAEKSQGTHTIRSRILIAAHGSWEPGSLPTQPPRRPPGPGDLFGFKAHFINAALSPGLMPLLSFPGGYGGMAHTDQDRVSFSCCVRRETLAAARRERPGISAAQAAFEHIRASCQGVQDALDGAGLDGRWLSVGPIQPGIRIKPTGGIFLVGNAAGEAHPAIAEGISIAMQSAWLLTGVLAHHRDDILLRGRPEAAAQEYARVWHEHFAARIRASGLFAAIAMHPEIAYRLAPVLYRWPWILTGCARWSGKARPIPLYV